MSYIERIAKAYPEISLTNDEVKRYGRHLIMPEVTLDGQKKLKAARVLVVGTGGLGSPLLAYLAAAGVGKLGIVDYDTVDYSNLHRQIIHKTGSVGKPKIESARDTMREINPHVEVELYNILLRSDNAMDVIKDYDIVVDGTDNFQTRYLTNDACVLLDKPNVYGSIFRFDGQVTVFWGSRGPCYRCLYPDPPPPGMVPSCAEGGVLGVLPGVVGTLQAAEVVKLIIGEGKLLVGRLMLYDALKAKVRELKLRKDPKCPICGENKTITELQDYDQFCGINTSPDAKTIGVPEVSVDDLKEMLDSTKDFDLVDVREEHEFDICKLDFPQTKYVPLSVLSSRMHELDSSREAMLICKNGERSAKAWKTLHNAGFRKIKNVAGGFDEWAEFIDPDMSIY